MTKKKDFTRDMINGIGGPSDTPDGFFDDDDDFSLEATDNLPASAFERKEKKIVKKENQPQAVEGKDFYYEDVPGVGKVMRLLTQPEKNPWGDDPQ